MDIKTTPLTWTFYNDIDHNGDCTNQPQRCDLCFMEETLKEYREYYFDISE